MFKNLGYLLTPRCLEITKHHQHGKAGASNGYRGKNVYRWKCSYLLLKIYIPAEFRKYFFQIWSHDFTSYIVSYISYPTIDRCLLLEITCLALSPTRVCQKENLYFKVYTHLLIRPLSMHSLNVYHASCNALGVGEKNGSSPCAKGAYRLLEEDRY